MNTVGGGGLAGGYGGYQIGNQRKEDEKQRVQEKFKTETRNIDQNRDFEPLGDEYGYIAKGQEDPEGQYSRHDDLEEAYKHYLDYEKQQFPEYIRNHPDRTGPAEQDPPHVGLQKMKYREDQRG